MNFLTKRQQQVLRRLVHGAATWKKTTAQSPLQKFDSPEDLPFEWSAWGLPRTNPEGFTNTPWTSTTTLRTLADAELVGDFLDGDGALCYTLTAKGRLLAGLLSGGDARVEEVGK